MNEPNRLKWEEQFEKDCLLYLKTKERIDDDYLLVVTLWQLRNCYQGKPFEKALETFRIERKRVLDGV